MDFFGSRALCAAVAAAVPGLCRAPWGFGGSFGLWSEAALLSLPGGDWFCLRDDAPLFRDLPGQSGSC